MNLHRGMDDDLYLTQNSLDRDSESKSRKPFRIKVRGNSIGDDLNGTIKSSRPLDSRRDTVPQPQMIEF
jgi:hypothetical protein